MDARARKIGIVLLGALLLGSAPGDPGLLLELDRAAFEISVRDLRDESAGPRFRVALGSPSHATPGGEFPLYRVVRSPEWKPGPDARAAGAKAEPASNRGPMGVAKIPFAEGGSIALHGGAHPRLLGKPISLGCVRAADADMLELLAWLESRDALSPTRERANGEHLQAFRRPARIRVR
jgi:hypothetical protein